MAKKNVHHSKHCMGSSILFEKLLTFRTLVLRKNKISHLTFRTLVLRKSKISHLTFRTLFSVRVSSKIALLGFRRVVLRKSIS